MKATDLEIGMTQELLRKLLHYDPDTGAFTWLVQPCRAVYPGMRAGCLHRGSGRHKIKVGNRSYYAARLAWLYMTGEWPPAMVDHENLDQGDDRWENQRAATRSQNNANRGGLASSETGIKGVYQKRGKRWYATIRKDGVIRHLGTFDTPDEAAAAYAKAANELFGEFARTA